jgi:hypothetical protein
MAISESLTITIPASSWRLLLRERGVVRAEVMKGGDFWPRKRYHLTYQSNTFSHGSGLLTSLLFPHILPSQLIYVDGDPFHLCPQNVEELSLEVKLSESSIAVSGYRYILLKLLDDAVCSWKFEHRPPGGRTVRKYVTVRGGVPPLPVPEYIKRTYLEFVQIVNRNHAISAPAEPRKYGLFCVLEALSQTHVNPGHSTGIYGISIKELRETEGQRIQKTRSWHQKPRTEEICRYWIISYTYQKKPHKEYYRISKGVPPLPVPKEIIKRNKVIRRHLDRGFDPTTFLPRMVL